MAPPSSFHHISCSAKVTAGTTSVSVPALNKSVMSSINVPTVKDQPMVPPNVTDQLASVSQQNLRNIPPKTDFLLPTPISAKRLAWYLSGYDRGKTSKLVTGFTAGFPLGTVGSIPPRTASNHRSTLEHISFVQDKLSKEITDKRIKGPYLSPPLPNFVCSPLGVVPKKTPNSYRLIHDLSFSRSLPSVNSMIPKENSTVTLETFDHVSALVLQSGRNSLVSKVDIEEAFRIVPITPLDYNKLGFTFQGRYYFDTVLPMGASSSVAIFESLAQSIQWILQNKCNVSKVSHIIDDFIFVGAPDSSECKIALDAFISLASDIGIPIKHDKTVMPTTQIVVHGIHIDTSTLMASLPDEKVTTLQQILFSCKKKRKVTLKQLQSVIGHLNFACKVIKPGRCFLRRLHDLTVGKTKGYHYIKLTKDSRADLDLWYTFLQKYNGCTLLTNDRFVSSVTLKLHSDAASTKGFACTHLTSWTFGAFPNEVKGHHINILELYPIALAVFLFGHQWENKNVCFVCDNLAVVYCLNKQTSKDSTMMKLIRIIVLKALECNFCFQSSHIPTSKNTICDKLSRFQVDEALSLAPFLDKDPTAIPLEMSPLMLLK
ncbi:uncharacterized protein LOC123524041 isoform X1 [Mercenaria mercenaria]|uniref:uncharacterized protein LOC123524041 isoform X1 n=1 Tax=Mercenaria mercenaria TaxID=6596 RepID=UPI001E1E1A9A|nr:uncharacterized protein LOC123524041 isoform X1 [Mercenaria mercenaria]